MAKKTPAIYRLCLTLGILGIIIGIVLIILGTTVLGEPFMDTIQPNFAIFVPGMFLTMISLSSLIYGLTPQIVKISAKNKKYLLNENKQEFKDIVDTTADISKDAVSTVANAIKHSDSPKLFCKYCGSENDADAQFCKKCGKKQN